LLGILAALIIAFLFVLAGVVFIRRKVPVAGWLIGGLAGVFVLSLALSTALGLHVAPGIKTRVDALNRTDIVQMQPFDRAVLKGDNIRYIYVPSDSYNLE